MKSDHIISNWLFTCALLVIAMIVIGGYTRLTDSGLSIVEWRPVTGTLPPISLDSWTEEFTKYKASPEYQKINIGMSLEEFKHIYYVEYFHRLMGRLLGLIFIIPFLYFIFSKKIPYKKAKPYFLILILLLFQGFMGWYMVKSGLVSNPHVSHFRLAAHLFMASLLLHLILWKAFNLRSIEKILDINLNIKRHCKFVILNIYIQIISGALVAGLDAGLIYNSFPLMDGDFLPKEITQSEYLFDIFTSPGGVQFIHRLIAYFLLVNICFFCYRLIRFYNASSLLVKATYSVLCLIFIQFMLGIATLLLVVPIYLALLHQLCGILLLINYIYIMHIMCKNFKR